jgi:hypothetical protein
MKKLLLIPILLLFVLSLNFPASAVELTCTPQSTVSVSPGLPSLANIQYQRLIQLTPPEYEVTDFTGGLYPNSNEPPANYLTTGISMANQISPLNTSGNPDPNGKIVFLSIGMSNTSQEFTAFINRVSELEAGGQFQKNPNLSIVNGAMSGQDTVRWQTDEFGNWTRVEGLLANRGLSADQVQAIWLKEARKEPGEFPNSINTLETELTTIIQNVKTYFPNTKIIYLTSRTRSYSYLDPLRPVETAAFETGIAVKRVIESYINGQLGDVPFLTWGPYIWEDNWPAEYLEDDCIHPSAQGEKAVAERLFDFFANSPTTTWFRANGEPPPPITLTPGNPTATPTAIQNQQSADVNNDGVVNYQDYTALMSQFGNTQCPNRADIDRNCKVDIFDYNILITELEDEITLSLIN